MVLSEVKANWKSLVKSTKTQLLFILLLLYVKRRHYEM